jgi:hypothetical protein
VKRVLIVRPDVSVSLPVAAMFAAGALGSIASSVWLFISLRSGDGASARKILLAMAASWMLIAPLPWALRKAVPHGKRTAVVLVACAALVGAISVWKQ